MAPCLEILLLTAIVLRVSAVGFEPVETNPAYDEAGFGWKSPRPTSGPFAEKADLKRAAGIFARSQHSLATCGYTSADFFAPVLCPLGQACGWLTAAPGGSPVSDVLVCCPEDFNGNAEWNQCPPPTTCQDYNSYSQHWTGSGSITISSTLYCGETDRICATLSFQGGYTGLSGLSTISFTSLFCSDVSTIEWAYQTYTNSLPSSTPSTTPITTTTPQTPPSSTTSPHPHTTSASPSPSPKNSTNVGAIAGGVVGGVVFGGAIVGGIIWFCIRRRRNRINTPEISQYSHYSSPSMKSP